MQAAQEIASSLNRLIQYMEQEEFRGFDPYDGLESPIFKIPALEHSLKFQFLFQQLIKRSPVNLRPMLGIKKGINPVTLGLALQSYTDLYRITSNEEYLEKAKTLLNHLVTLRSPGFYGDCWGYNFRWSSRYALIPSGQPTVVATGIIVNGIYSYWQVNKDPDAAEVIQNAAEFVTQSLYHTKDHDGLCFSYSPFDQEQVFNASMKGARILAQAASITPNMHYKELVYSATNWLCKKQNSNGSWRYSLSRAGSRVDNYHTGYILDCLTACIQLCAMPEFQSSLERGRTYYRDHFFALNGQPKFYNTRLWPADCTAGAQSVLSLCNMQQPKLAVNTAQWLIQNMQSEKGFFYFRKYPSHTEKTSFMRWSNAWMMAALSRLQLELREGGVHA